MKKLAIFMSVAIILTSTFSFGRVTSINEKEASSAVNEPVSVLAPNALKTPVFQKLDSEVVKAVKETGGKIISKELKQLNGKSYFRPEVNASEFTSIDATGTNKKGIAILVDFPLVEGGSATGGVPGVDYAQIPMKQFDALLNGTVYNPYKLDVFKNLATFTQKDAAGNIIKVYNAPTNRTLRNYYSEVSYGKFMINVDVTPWITLPHTYEYYMGQNKGYINENGDAFMGQLVYDAIKAADSSVDFSQYAEAATPEDIWTYEDDGTPYTLEDGKAVEMIVPNVFIIHRGTGAEFSSDPSVIWSHKWDIMSAKYFGYMDQNNGNAMPDEHDLKYTTVDGVAVNTYNICPEVGRDITGYLSTAYPDSFPSTYTGSDPAPAYPGVYTHEFGHVLGLPDQYDYGYDSEGTGMYTLMAGGSYGRNIPSGFYSGNTPVHMDAWSKAYLNFTQPTLITKSKSITINPSSTSKDVFRIDVPGSKGREYFLLENRQQLGFDVGLAYMVDGANTHGLAIYHIVNDVLVRNFGRPNEAQNWDNNHLGLSNFIDSGTGEHHYGISLLQADGNFDLEKYNNDGDSGDLFPGKMNVTSLLSSQNAKVNTTSLYKWNNKTTETGITIKNIVEKNGVITCDVVIGK